MHFSRDGATAPLPCIRWTLPAVWKSDLLHLPHKGLERKRGSVWESLLSHQKQQPSAAEPHLSCGPTRSEACWRLMHVHCLAWRTPLSDSREVPVSHVAIVRGRHWDMDSVHREQDLFQRVCEWSFGKRLSLCWNETLFFIFLLPGHLMRARNM